MLFHDTDHTRRRILRGGLAVALAATSGLGLAACQDKAPDFNSTDISGADIGKGWTLPDVQGVARSAADFTGKVVVVFFGFIQCPDVCPTALAELAQVRSLLAEDAERMQVLFITVDPERDTPEIIREYLANFDSSFIGLRGDAEQLKTVAQRFKAYYAKTPIEGGYTMDHSAGLYLFDTEGRIRLFAGQTHTPEDLAADIRLLLA